MVTVWFVVSMMDSDAIPSNEKSVILFASFATALLETVISHGCVVVPSSATTEKVTGEE